MKTTKDQLNRVKLYETALSFLGVDASPKDQAPDDLGCADSVTQVILTAFPNCIKGSIGTAGLYNQLNTSPQFRKVMDFNFGDVIISPTGMGKKNMPHGHTGIVGEGEEIMSNSSSLGIWQTNYTVVSWVAKYRKIGGYPIYFFRKV